MIKFFLFNTNKKKYIKNTWKSQWFSDSNYTILFFEDDIVHQYLDIVNKILFNLSISLFIGRYKMKTIKYTILFKTFVIDLNYSQFVTSLGYRLGNLRYSLNYFCRVLYMQKYLFLICCLFYFLKFYGKETY